MAYSDTGLYNVQSTLFAWLYAQLVANKPPAISTVTLRAEWPELPITAPLWSVILLDADEGDGYQGGAVSGSQYGNMQFGIAQIDCWTSRENNPNWVQQVAQMQDAVTKAVNGLRKTGSSITIKDFYTSTSTPADTAYRLTIDRLERGTAPIDPNPDIERKRLLLFFQWVERR